MKLNKKHFSDSYLLQSKYLACLETTIIDEDMIVIESQRGVTLHGNMFYMLQELVCNKKYENFKVYLSVNKRNYNEFSKLLEQYELNVKLLLMGTETYYRIISSAKYIMTDTTHLVSFIKKEGQVILNVWHGTPLKTLGRKDNSGGHTLGNVQKSFFIADYLLYPSQYMMKHMLEDYMLENIAKGKCLLAGYPRNEVFFKEPNQSIIEELGLEGKEVIGYMPTWRGAVGGVDKKKQMIHIGHYLLELDKQLKEDQVLLVNLHPFVGNALDYKMFKNIKPFPKKYETYDVLNICDQLITDYSSVFFDFAITKRKVLLFAYDEEEYLAERGLYIGLEELPFPILKTLPELVEAINTPKSYDDTEFLETYAKYDNVNASEKLLDRVLLEQKGICEVDIPNNGKENVIIYSGNLAKNGITTALFNLLQEIDLDKYNYYLTFASKAVTKNKEQLLNIPQKVGYIPTMGRMNAGLYDKIFVLLAKEIKFKANYKRKELCRLYKYEINRVYGNINFSHAIQYSGYEMKKQMLFGRFDCNKVIYVHNNIVSEINAKGAHKPNVIRYAYNHYDKVAIVTEDMRDPTLEFCNDENKVVVANNIIDYKSILLKSKEELTFDANTMSTVDKEELEQILQGNHKVFINIGRFSEEKGHFRLIDAFSKLYENADTKPYLVILGGYGRLYKDTLEYASGKSCADHIIIIKSMSNPFPLLKRCDYFVLSSSHEGFGLVLAEADILGIPVMSTDILGPKLFMEKHGGLLVEETVEAICEGMERMLQGEVKVLGVDYEVMNKKSVDQFESMLSAKKG